MIKSLVSLGVPVFNGENYLEECVRSLLAQNRDRIEIIISDNGSTDATPEICREFASQDSRITYLRHSENRGAAWNYNQCFQRSRGEFFSWTPHDDIRTPSFVNVLADALGSAGPEHVLASGRAVFIDSAGEVIGPDIDVMPARSSWAFRRLGSALNNLNSAAPVFGLIRREALERTRLIGPFVASDYVLICELALLGKMTEVEDLTFMRRLHPSSSREANTSRESVQAWFDPHTEVGGRSDKWRLFREYQRSVGALGVGASERFLCRVTIPIVMASRGSRVLVGRWRRRMVGSEAIPNPPRPRQTDESGLGRVEEDLMGTR